MLPKIKNYMVLSNQQRYLKFLKKTKILRLSSSLIQPVKEIKSIGEFKVILNLHSEIESSLLKLK